MLKTTIENINNFVTKHNQCLSSWASVISIISLPLIILGLFLSYHQLSEILNDPDVELEFVHPTSIAYKINNISDKIAEDVLVSFGIFDIDAEPPGVLPIPAEQIDYINPKSGKGPFTFLGKHGIKGNRYFGMVYVGCRGGKHLKTYWIHAQQGHPNESFYVKRNRKDTYAVNPYKIKNDESYLKEIVPTERRIYIKE